MRDSISSIKQQLQQLQEQCVAGVVPQQQYEAEKAALERKLLDLVLAGTAAQGSSWRMFAGIAVATLAIAGLGYWWTTGSSRTQSNPVHSGAVPGMSGAMSNAVPGASSMPAGAGSAPHGTDSDQVASMTDRLAARLKDKPEDAEGWAMLARSYSVLGRHPEALKAYEKAVALRKDDANLLADYADSLAVRNNRVLAGEPLKLVERALKLEPHNLKALSMAGSEAFDRRDYARAVQFWEQVVAFGPADGPMVQQILPSLELARQATGAPTAAAKKTKP